MSYYQLIPEKILSIFPEIENFIRPYIKGYCKDYMMEVISLVACRSRKDGSIPQLQMTHFKKLVPQGDKYLKKLMALEVIKRSGSYKPKIRSYKYSFYPEYRSKCVPLPLNNMKLIRRMQMARKIEKKAKSNRGCTGQVRLLRKLEIHDDCMEFIEENYAEDNVRYNSAMGSVVRIRNNDFHFNVDQTSGRFHSNVTNMPKGLRQFLRVNGSPLINLDIKNSQPYFSTLLLTNPSKVASTAKNAAFGMLLQTLDVPQTEDVKKYISLVVSGQIYEWMAKLFAKEGIHLTRDETKKQLFKILFARNRAPKKLTSRMCRQIFKENFPTVHKVFTRVRGSSRGKEFSSYERKFINYKRFSILLQTIESQLILRVILKRVYKEIPNVVALTIHDSLLVGVNSGHLVKVRKIMLEELTHFVGHPPQIKEEGDTVEDKGGRIESINSRHYPATTLVNAS